MFLQRSAAPLALNTSTRLVLAAAWLCVFAPSRNANGALPFPDEQWWDGAFDLKGLDGPAFSTAVSGPTVYVAGNFEYAGTVRSRGLAKWDGTAWSRLGLGLQSTTDWVDEVVTDGTNVYAAGFFNQVRQSGGAVVAATNIARWNGSSWSKLRGGVDWGAQTLALGHGVLFAGGYFTNADGLDLRYIARWDGTNWSGLGAGLNGPVSKSVFAGNDLFVTGSFTLAGGMNATNFARWDGTNWWPVDHSPFISVDALSVHGSDLLVGGAIHYQPNFPPISALYRWTGNQWLPVTTNIIGQISAVAGATNGFYVGGDLTSIEGVHVGSLAFGTECGWISLGSGTDNPPSAMVTAGDTLYAVGSFGLAGGKPSRHIARWKGGSVPWVEVLDQQLVEGVAGHSFLVFPVRMCPAPTSPLLVSYATSNGTAMANSDYTPVFGSLSFTTQSSFQAITVPLLGDRFYEPDETFYVMLSSTGRVVFSQTAATGTILNDDPLPSISVSDAAVAEGNLGTNSILFNVSLSSPHAETVLVDYRTVDGSAQEGIDFLDPGRGYPVSGRLTFLPGTTNQTVAIPVLTDTFLEPDKEFILQVVGAWPALPLAKPMGIGWILNDDLVPTLAFNWPNTSSHVSVFEGVSSRIQRYALILSGPIDRTVSVDYVTTDGSATAGSDYLAAFGRLVYPPGTTTQYVSISILGDFYSEPEETFTINLFNATNTTLLYTQVVVSILNDDPFELAPEFAVSLVTTNLLQPTRMEFAPDGRLFVCEQAGALRVIKNGVLLPEPFLRIATTSTSDTEAGLLGVTFDAGFLTNQFLYVFYTATSPPNSSTPDRRLRNRISRFTALGDSARAGSEIVLFEMGDVLDSSFHNGGDLHFGPDGKLYVSVGDNTITEITPKG